MAAGQRVLAEAPEAITELGADRVRGKAVIDVAALS